MGGWEWSKVSSSSILSSFLCSGVSFSMSGDGWFSMLSSSDGCGGMKRGSPGVCLRLEI